jgi:hypothetical protein
VGHPRPGYGFGGNGRPYSSNYKESIMYWNTKERKYLIENHNKKTLKAIGQHLGRSLFSVRHMAVSLREQKVLPLKHPNWTPEEHQYLLDNLHRSNKVIALKLNRTYWSIKSRKRQIALGEVFFKN